MSGLFGIGDSSDNTNINTYLRNTQTVLSHFSWYVTETWTAPDAPIGLGRCGASILNRELQPNISRNGDIILFMTGEFYHTISLEKQLEPADCKPRNASHPEMALNACQAFGTDIARHLDGVFIIAIYDQTRRRVILANDRMGQYPTDYAHKTSRPVFSPEVKAVLTAPFIE